MRHATGPVLRRPAAAAPGGVVLPALGLAVLAVVAALAAGLTAGTSTPDRSGSDGFSRPVADLVLPTPGVLGGEQAEDVQGRTP